MINNVKKTKTKAVFYALGEEDELIQQASTFVDKVIKTDVASVDKKVVDKKKVKGGVL